MLDVIIPSAEYWDSEKEEFVTIKGQAIKIEHSLLSISKWETKWKRPFLDPTKELTHEETIDYIRCMTITQNVDPSLYDFIPNSELQKVVDYVKDHRSAHVLSKGKPNRAAYSSERFYFLMATYNIPFSCEKWHFSRLMSLLDIAAEENKPKKKMSTGEIFRQNADLNRARRAALKTKG